MLMGCDQSSGEVNLAVVPADLRLCFDRLVPIPPQGKMSAQQVARLVADLRRSEVAKSRCGKRLLSWYDKQAAVYSKGGRR